MLSSFVFNPALVNLLTGSNSPNKSVKKGIKSKKQREHLYKTQLFDAIKASDSKAVKTCIAKVRNLDGLRDDKGHSVLHLALKFGSFEIVSYVLNELKKQGKDKYEAVLNSLDHVAKTPLHMAAKHATCQTTALLIKELGAKAHPAALKITHNKGSLPIELRSGNPNLKDQQSTDRMKKLLEDITLEKPTNKLNEPISLDVIINKTPAQYLYQKGCDDIKLACNAANNVRKRFTKSYTHPTSNSFSPKEFNDVYTELLTLRRECKKLDSAIPSTLDNDSRYLKRLDNIDVVFSPRHNANCHEFAQLTVRELKNLGYRGPLEVFSLEHGADHVFTVMGRDQSTSMLNFKKWNKDTLIIDSWGGDVFPASEISKRLKNYRAYPNSWTPAASIVIPFDQDYNSFNRCELFYPKRPIAAVTPTTAAPAPSSKRLKTGP